MTFSEWSAIKEYIDAAVNEERVRRQYAAGLTYLLEAAGKNKDEAEQAVLDLIKDFS